MLKLNDNLSLFNYDEFWMKRALFYAHKSLIYKEVPIGAVLTYENNEISNGFNLSILQNDPTAHAEINTLRNAALILSNYRLPNTTLYVTLEPCIMCFGALLLARVDRLVFGAYSSNKFNKFNKFNILNLLNNDKNKINYLGGVLAEESSILLKKFFYNRR